jgi:hypothetical protein
MLSGALKLNLTAEEKHVYGQLFRLADTDNVGVVTGEVAVKFFEKTRLDSRVLGEVGNLLILYIVSFSYTTLRRANRTDNVCLNSRYGRLPTEKTVASSHLPGLALCCGLLAMLKQAANRPPRLLYNRDHSHASTASLRPLHRCCQTHCLDHPPDPHLRVSLPKAPVPLLSASLL